MGCPQPSVATKFLRWLAVVGLAAGCAPWLRAQASAAVDAPYTLHVYEDLVQVTALVLDRSRQPVTELRPEDFALQLDAGPVFHPRHMRLEGDDPLSVAILLDESWKGADEFTRLLADSLAHLPAGAFTAADRVSVYAFDCNMLVAARDVAAASSALPASISRALSVPALHLPATGGGARCNRTVNLWDALKVVGLQQQHAPGRRILLAFSPGTGTASRNTPEAIRLALAGESISVFGAIPVSSTLPGAGWGSQEKAFDLLCGGTGGMTTGVTAEKTALWLAETLKRVRDRYVLEFNRPSNESAGLHQLDVTTRRKTDRVFVSGTLVPLRDPRLAADPSTVPNMPVASPVMGSRKTLKPE